MSALMSVNRFDNRLDVGLATAVSVRLDIAYFTALINMRPSWIACRPLICQRVMIFLVSVLTFRLSDLDLFYFLYSKFYIIEQSRKMTFLVSFFLDVV